MKTLKLLGAAAAAVTMTFAAQAAKTAKVVLADSGATLKFVYDETNYGTKGTDWFSVAEAEAINPYSDHVPWYGCREDVTKAVFDSSFADYRPTQCGHWFYCFESLSAIEGIGNLDTSAATSLANMFCGCPSLTSLDVTGFDTANVTSMYGMFSRTSLTSLDLSGFDTSKVTDMGYMLYNCSSLETIFTSDAFVTTAVTNSSSMFTFSMKLVGGAGTTFDKTKTDATYARIDGGPSSATPGYFTRRDRIAKVVVEDGGKTLRFVYDGKDYDTKDAEWFSVAEAETIDPYSDTVPWYFCGVTVTKVVFDSSFAAYRPKQCGSWFYDFGVLAAVDGLKNLNTSVTTNMAYIFAGCESLTSLDVSGFDTSKVTDMTFMFGGCSSLTTMDVSGFDTANVTDMYSMFYGCSSLTSLDVSGFDTANVTDMDSMFGDCSSLTTLDVTGFDTAMVTDMCWMFGGCSSLTTLDVTGFDTANVTDMYSMFYGCSSLTSLDLTGFDTANVTDMRYMFCGCSSLEAICASDRFVTDQVQFSSDMFQSCSKLVGGAGTAYDPAKTDKTYARIDGKDGQPGYFTSAVPTLFDSFTPGALNPKGATYNGFLGEESLGGTFTLVVKKPKKGQTSAAATLTKIDPATGKKVKVKGTVDAATGVCGGGLAGLQLNAKGVGGSLGGAPAQGAVDGAKAKDAAAIAVMNGFDKRAYGLVFADAAGEWAYLTATFSKKGKVKVAGTFRGAKVSGKAQLCVGDRCAVPFVWSKRGVRVSFVLWFDKAKKALVDVTGLGKGATLVDVGSAAAPANGTYRAVLAAADVLASVPAAIAATPLVTRAAFNGKKFDAGKAAKVTYKKGVLDVNTEKGDNVSALKLAYSKGALKGSFTVYAVTGGKLVKNKFKVAGVVVGGVGYAAGTNKKLKSIPLVLTK